MNNTLIPLHPAAERLGLLYAYHFTSGQPGHALTMAPEDPWDAEEGGFRWLHFNLAHAAAERWMREHLGLPEEFFESLHAGSHSTRLEPADDTLLGVVNDVTLAYGQVSVDVATLWACARPGLLVTARAQPLRSVDRLRHAVRRGEGFGSTLELLVHLLRDQADVLTGIIRDTTVKVDAIEDRLLSQRLSASRAELGSLRRALVRLQRLLALEPGSLLRLLNRPPAWLRRDDIQTLREATEEFDRVLDDLAALVERLKLLQEEIAAASAEQTNRTLFTLTLVTVLALPINIIAGFFGMNVGGIPLADSPHGFWILVALVATFTVLAGSLAFRKRGD